MQLTVYQAQLSGNSSGLSSLQFYFFLPPNEVSFSFDFNFHFPFTFSPRVKMFQGKEKKVHFLHRDENPPLSTAD